MIEGLDLDSDTRLLVVVPHPDDETLATGGLIQIALDAGAVLRVVIATDGDNNPWPQRWVEKRWQIDAEARRRWGRCRRSEAAEALARLGVSRANIRHYGWPDQGLTGLLMRDAQCEDQLVAEIVDFAPTLMVAPSLADRHPDHSALRVMIELALARTAFASCRRFGFVVHGPLRDDLAFAMATSAEQVRIKQHALHAHASQLVLSSKRMHRLCARVERFELPSSITQPGDEAGRLDWTLPWPRPRMRLHRSALYLIAEVDDRIERISVPLSARTRVVDARVGPGDPPLLDLRMQAAGDTLRIGLSSPRRIGRVFAKIERLGARLVIYDGHGWFGNEACSR
ncbi:MAG: PIG-L family deacetylase [Xanthomonadales bacterium]|nr:PIG-L family deacetylase [Xanthomonadales bacterium]MBK7013301.1 PIG-L family deacetylase [Xanthomonadales bacterium]MBK7211537.1 PIG-L family deacetylase [Xanthomonadales bacterium]HQZ63015.1 PIG-L family deacetylase [Dokdonella sp.]